MRQQIIRAVAVTIGVLLGSFIGAWSHVARLEGEVPREEVDRFLAVAVFDIGGHGAVTGAALLLLSSLAFGNERQRQQTDFRRRIQLLGQSGRISTEAFGELLGAIEDEQRR